MRFIGDTALHGAESGQHLVFRGAPAFHVLEVPQKRPPAVAVIEADQGVSARSDEIPAKTPDGARTILGVVKDAQGNDHIEGPPGCVLEQP